MDKPIIVDPQRVMPFVVDETYTYRMLLDDAMADRRTIQINHGTVAPGCALGGGVHGQDEIYYIISGEGTLTLGETIIPVYPGLTIFIPKGCFHALLNLAAARMIERLRVRRHMEMWGPANGIDPARE